MALLKTTSKQYIKVELDGHFVIYASEQERLLEKNATPFTKVVQKYESKIKELSKNKERLYYDPKYFELVTAWKQEFETYMIAYRKKDYTKNFPLMKKYIKDISNTIPKIVNRGRIGVRGQTLGEVYIFVKAIKIFSDVEDI